MMKILRKALILICFILGFTSYGQNLGGPTCADAVPFCTAELNQPFDNCFNGNPNPDCASSGETGPDYTCLGSTPFPTWYFLQIETAGDLNFTIFQNTDIADDGTLNGTPLDVDFTLWGPFSDTNVCGNLTAANTVDCSFSGAAVETANIPNAQVGEIYVFLITNFAQQQGEIFIDQADNDTGATDCSIVDPALGPDIDVCEGTVVTLDATDPTAANYTWTFDDGTGPVPIPGTDGMPMIDVTQSGVYEVTITTFDGDMGTDDIIVTFFEIPVPVAPPTQQICDDASNDGVEDFNLEILEPTILNGADPMMFSVTFHLSQADADTNTAAITGTNPYNSADDTIFVRVENDGLTDCFATVQFDLDVVDRPAPIDPGPFIVCDNATDGSDTNGFTFFNLASLNGTIFGAQDPTLFTLTYHIDANDALLDQNPLPLNFENTDVGGQTIFARLENDAFADCFTAIPIVLEVAPLPVIIDPAPLLTQCDDDTDGFSVFNLTEAESLISSDAANETFQYFDSLGNPITDPIAYTNSTVNNETLDVLVTTVNGCSRPAQLLLEVDTSQIPANFSVDFSECDTDSDGVAIFDFTTATPQILALFPPGQLLTVTYYETLQEALTEVNAITDISNYANNLAFTDVNGLQGIYVRVDGDTANDCVGLGIHVQLRVLPNPVLNTDVSDFIECSDDADFGIFDLTSKDIEITGGNPDY
ncbi:iron-regulated protein FrpC, partial [Dokdonia ponticola]